MLKMGYIIGEGLGKDGTGRAEPVPIQLLPQGMHDSWIVVQFDFLSHTVKIRCVLDTILINILGKSLDKIMELKEQAGDKDLYDVMKKKQKHQRKSEKSMAKQHTVKKSSGKINVFDFINKKLKGKKGENVNLSSIISKAHLHRGLRRRTQFFPFMVCVAGCE